MQTILTILCFLLTFRSIAQTGNVGIGTTTPHASARLDITDTNKGMLIPRMTAAQRAAIANPAIGLLLYQTDGTKGFYYFDGTVWQNVTEGVVPGTNGIISALGGGNVSTLAKNDDSNPIGSIPKFNEPCGVALTPSGGLIVGDARNYRITSVNTSSGAVSPFAGGGGQGYVDGQSLTSARFNYPCGLTMDNGLNTYIADRDNNVIRKINSASSGGGVYTLAGDGMMGSINDTGKAARFNKPFSLALDPTGTLLYVADANNHTIRKITLSTQVVTTLAGGGTSGTASGWVDGNDSSARFRFPTGVAIDKAGNVYVADSGNCRIRKITPVGAVTTLAGSGSRSFGDDIGLAASFSGPSSVALDTFGNVYVADAGNNRIRKITPVGVVTTLAGSGSRGAVDGNGTTASFDRPISLVVNKEGIIYVADLENDRIRTIVQGGGSIYVTTAGLLNNMTTNSITTPSTNSNNMLAVAYGNIIIGSNPGFFGSSSGNCTLIHPTTGVHTIRFTSSNLSGVNLGNLPVVVSLYGSFIPPPGRITWSGTTGSITIHTFDTSGNPADRNFNFVVYKP